MQTQTTPDPVTTAVSPDAPGLPATPEAHPSPRPAVRRVAQPDFRAALSAAFRRLGASVAPATSFDRSKAFFRATGAAWTRALS